MLIKNKINEYNRYRRLKGHCRVNIVVKNINPFPADPDYCHF